MEQVLLDIRLALDPLVASMWDTLEDTMALIQAAILTVRENAQQGAVHKVADRSKDTRNEFFRRNYRLKK